MELVPYDPIFASWQQGDHGGARFERRTFRWGAPYEVSVTLVMLRGYGGGPTWSSRHDPRYQPELTCVTCPFWGVDKYGTNYCAHPFYLEAAGCPQSNGQGRGGNGARADTECPMLGKRDWRKRRRTRVRWKAEDLVNYFGGDLDDVPRWVRAGFWAGIRMTGRMWRTEDDIPFHPSRLPINEKEPA